MNTVETRTHTDSPVQKIIQLPPRIFNRIYFLFIFDSIMHILFTQKGAKDRKQGFNLADENQAGVTFF